MVLADRVVMGLAAHLLVIQTVLEANPCRRVLLSIALARKHAELGGPDGRLCAVGDP